jgi:hypothetical protein
MWIVLCRRHDHSGLWAFERLRRRARLQPLELVLIEDLSSPQVRWEQRIDGGGAAVRIDLPDGRRLDSSATRGVLNRMLGALGGAAALAHPDDREYAVSELAAFAASWLHCLAPLVINPPKPNGLAGPFLHPLQWRALAHEAGLDVAPFHADSDAPPAMQIDPVGTALLAVDGELLADGAPAEVQAGVHALAALSGLPLLAVRFAGAPERTGEWRFLDASSFPDLSAGGEAGVEAIEAALAS